MTQEKELETLFSAAITEFSDNDQFLDQLSAKLDKVEYLKCVQKEQNRRYRMNLVLAFVSGASAMLAALLLLPLLPSDMQIIESIIHQGRDITFSGDAKVLSTLMIVALTYGLVFSINSVRRGIREFRLKPNA